MTVLAVGSGCLAGCTNHEIEDHPDLDRMLDFQECIMDERTVGVAAAVLIVFVAFVIFIHSSVCSTPSVVYCETNSNGIHQHTFTIPP